MIFLCRDDFNGILCGVYDAFMSRLGHANVKLQLQNTVNLEMFAEYRDVEESEEKLKKVIKAIRGKLSSEAYRWVYQASLSWEEGKADIIYRFLIYAFAWGPKVMENLKIPAVYEIFRLNRAVLGETHLLTEFVRFSEMKGKILFSKIGPKNDVTVLLAPHFADRFSGEQWIIYDEHRRKAAVHAPDKGWLILSADKEEWEEKLTEETDGHLYQQLWKTFCTSVAITARTNYVCQRGHLPLRYRSYMTEFQE